MNNSPCRFLKFRTSGFTLVETLIVMVALGIAAAAIVGLQSSIFQGQTANQGMVVDTQRMQECAEKILQTRRNSSTGYASVTNTLCEHQTIGTDPTVTLTDSGGNTVATCSGTTTCKVTISSGGLPAVIIQLINY